MSEGIEPLYLDIDFLCRLSPLISLGLASLVLITHILLRMEMCAIGNFDPLQWPL